MPMLQTTLGASAAVAVHGKRGTSSSAQGANNPTASPGSNLWNSAETVEKHRLMATRAPSPRRARRPERSRSAVWWSIGGDRDGTRDR